MGYETSLLASACAGDLSTSPVTPPDDPVRPKHYRGDLVMRIIETFGLQDDFYISNAVKYLLRFRLKGGIEDIKKAIWYLQRMVERAEGKHTEGVR